MTVSFSTGVEEQRFFGKWKDYIEGVSKIQHFNGGEDVIILPVGNGLLGNIQFIC